MAVPVLTKTGAVDSSSDTAEKMVSRVNERGAERIMSMVVNMYSNPNVAVAREYIANAVDATIVAGTGVPVEVSTPTRLNPNFVVADRGTGMSKDELEEAFLAFAASTKTDSNDVVGGLGVGAKSAWTICDAFLVNTVKDGKRNIVRASRDLEHEVLVSDAPTEDPNGTTITVPVNMDDADWVHIISRVAVVHPQGAVSVDGHAAQSIHDKSKWIGPIYPNSLPNEESIVVVSGGTLFGVPGELRRFFTDLTNIYDAVITLPVGSFEHTPSREHLIPSEITKNALRKAVDEFKSAHSKLSKRIAAVAEKSPTKAVTRRAEILGNAQSSRRLIPLDYRVVVPRNIAYKVTRSGTAASATVWSLGTLSEALEIRTAYGDLISSAVLVTGVPEGRQLKGIGRFMDTHHRTKRTVIALHGDATEVNLKVTRIATADSKDDPGVGDGFTVSTKSKGITVVAYGDLKKECKVLSEKARANRPARQSRSYRVYSFIDGARTLKSMTFEDVRDIVNNTDEVTVAVTQHGSVVNEAAIGDRNVVVFDTEGLSVNPILKAFPEAVDAHSLSRNLAEKALSAFDDEVITAATMSRMHDDALFYLAAQAVKVLDTDSPAYKLMVPMADVVRVIKERGDEVTKVTRLIRHNYTQISDGKYVTANTLVDALLTAYPLIPRGYRSVRDMDREHIINYIMSVPPVA